jgi:uncharacterized protein YdhG (YjbR/CyaY superfamily)
MPTDTPLDDYLAKQPPDQRESLRDLRARVLGLVPDAVDSMGYGMPMLRVDGKGLIWFAAWKRHCSVYPVSPAFIAAHPALADHGHTDKGALHFSARQPLPAGVVEDLVRERLAELASG